MAKKLKTNQNLSTTEPKKPDTEALETALFDMVSAIKGSERESVRPQIELIQQFIGSQRNMFEDRRKIVWGKDGKARQTIDSRKNYEITWRNGMHPVYMSIQEAADLIGKPVSGLRAYLAKNGGTYHWTDPSDMDIVTIKRLNTL